MLQNRKQLENLENLRKILNKKKFPTKLINKVTKQYLDLKFDKMSLQTKTEVKTDATFFRRTLANILTLLKKDSKCC